MPQFSLACSTSPPPQKKKKKKKNPPKINNINLIKQENVNKLDQQQIKD
jgi:hypothetical protein